MKTFAENEYSFPPPLPKVFKTNKSSCCKSDKIMTKIDTKLPNLDGFLKVGEKLHKSQKLNRINTPRAKYGPRLRLWPYLALGLFIRFSLIFVLYVLFCQWNLEISE